MNFVTIFSDGSDQEVYQINYSSTLSDFAVEISEMINKFTFFGPIAKSYLKGSLLPVVPNLDITRLNLENEVFYDSTTFQDVDYELICIPQKLRGELNVPRVWIYCIYFDGGTYISEITTSNMENPDEIWKKYYSNVNCDLNIKTRKIITSAISLVDEFNAVENLYGVSIFKSIDICVYKVKLKI